MGGPRKVRICHLNCVSTQLSTGVDKRHRCDPRTRFGSWYGVCDSLTCIDADCLSCDRTNCVAVPARSAAMSSTVTPSVAPDRHCLCMNDGTVRSGASLTGSDSISTLEQSPNSEVADACWLLTVCLHSDFSLGRLATSSELAENLYSRRRQIGVVESRGVLTVAKGKRTFQPNNRRRARVHGFRLRMRTRAGRAIVSARRGKGRKELTA